jgi:cell wall-associated NlpC family hydrolase
MALPSGLSDVLSRIQQLRDLVGQAPVAAASGGSDFASALAAASGAAAAGTAGPTAGSAGGPTGQDVVADARKYLGTPYVWGGTDPATGLDCSGLVQRVYKDLGIALPRVSHDQAGVGQAVPNLAAARPGDILAFGHPVHHVGIYAGNGQMIDAPQPGDKVKLEKVWETPVAIRRVLPADPTRRPAAAGGAGALAGVPYGADFAAAAAKYGLPATLLAAVAKVESGYDPNAVSPAGARGLMQLMPGTAAGLGVNPMDPTQAIDGAARLLAGNLREFGSLPLALAAYNAGGGAVRTYGGIPPYPETKAYVGRVQAAMAALGSGVAA